MLVIISLMLGMMMTALVEYIKYRGGTIEMGKLEKEFGASVKFQCEKDYPEEDFVRLTVAIRKMTGCSTEQEVCECQQQFAKFMHRILLKRYPAIISRYSTYEELLLNIHEAHQQIPFIKNPDKLWSEQGTEGIIIHYRSATKFDCFFGQMLLEFAKQFSTKIKMNYKKKMTNGDDETVAVVKIVNT